MNINKKSSRIKRIATKSRKARENIRLRGKHGATENNKADNKRIKSD